MGRDTAQLEDVPEDGEEESPDEVAGSLNLLAAKGCEREEDWECKVGEEVWYRETVRA